MKDNSKSTEITDAEIQEYISRMADGSRFDTTVKDLTKYINDHKLKLLSYKDEIHGDDGDFEIAKKKAADFINGDDVPTETQDSLYYFELSLLELENAKKYIDDRDIYGASIFFSFSTYNLGLLRSAIGESNIRSQIASNASKKRHESNRKIKAKALDFYEANIKTFRTKTEAAEKISADIVPREYSVVRKWITEFHKQQK